MIPQANRRIKLHEVPDLTADPVEYRRLLDDMIEHSGPLLPEPNWLMTEDVSAAADSYERDKALRFAFTYEAFDKISHFKNLMSAWVGGSQPPSELEISKYRDFFRDCDVLNLWSGNVESILSDSEGYQLAGGNLLDGEEANDDLRQSIKNRIAMPTVPLCRQDLGSLMDLNLLYAFTHPRQGVTRILEVGGGYGRLAEAAWNIFGPSIQYVMVDAVPASLYYANKYLSAACHGARVRSYYDSGPFDLRDCDIAIIPAWHFERLNTLRYDVCVNIESMQEMNQHHVDYYLHLFNDVSVDRATIYISNAHDYYFKGKFNYPSNWKKLFGSNTPRSNLCLDHPTEIFRKVSV